MTTTHGFVIQCYSVGKITIKELFVETFISSEMRVTVEYKNFYVELTMH